MEGYWYHQFKKNVVASMY